MAAPGVPLTLVVERPDGVEYRRALVADQGVGGRSSTCRSSPSASTGTWRVRAFTDPKRPAVGETTLPGRGLCARPHRVRSRHRRARRSRAARRRRSRVDGRYLYGAPASGLDLEGEVTIAPPSERPGFAGYPVRPGRRGGRRRARQALEDLPQTDAQRQGAASRSRSTSCRRPTRPLEAQIIVRMAEAGGRAVERKLTLPVAPDAPMIGVKPLFSGRSLGEGENATSTWSWSRPTASTLARQGPALRAAQDRDPLSVVPAGRPAGNTSRSSAPSASPTARSTSPPTSRRASRCRCNGAAIGSKCRPASRTAAHLGRVRRRLVRRSERRHARHAGDRARQAGIQARRDA